MDLWVSTNKGLFRMAGDGRGLASKSHFFPGVSSPVMLPPDASGLGLAALKHGHFGSKLHRTLDGGITWTPVATPAYPEYPKDLPPDINPVSGKPTPWNLELIWSIERGGLPNEFWLGTIPGGLFRSTDGGATWSLCEPLWNDPRRKSWFGGGYDHAGIHSICVDPTDPAHLVLAVSTAGVWETRDSGATWAQIGHGMIATYMPPGQQTDPAVQDVHRMAACPTSFRHMWVQHHCGMFRSEDAGHTFAKVGPDMGADPSGFGFAVAVHPTDPDTAWFVPATSDECRIPVAGRVELLRTRDGGKTFQQLHRGLPQSDAYDLTYRHSLDVAPDGKTLAFGTTTGNLYLSRDQGDSWTAVSTTLPPILSVRFG
jgi:hypothetical protein